MRALPAMRWLAPLACVLVVQQTSQAPAGDILRGGTPANQKRAAGNSALTSAAVEKARVNARDTLARTTKAIQSVQALQNAARNLAGKGANNLGADPRHPGSQLKDVPDGLAPGGLDLISKDAGVKSVTGAVVDNRSKVTVKQTAQQAFLAWKTFNVGRNTTLTFDQSAGGSSAGQWIAFNEIKDPSGSPSQILGSINAQGQVYVINQNGIIFGGTSQVNAHALVVSALPINTNLTSRGLLNNPDVQFLFSALPLAAGTNGTPAFTPLDINGQPLGPNAKMGDVTVQPGATLSAPTSVDHVGGRVALIGANVTNQGTISTPDGQTILAAGLQVGMGAHSSKDPSLRGLDVFVGAVKNPDPASTLGEYAGTATNAGLINAARANVTVTGKTVNQMGAISSSTSVSLNGRVDLIASYGATGNPRYDPANTSTGAPFLYSADGVVTLGPGSVTRILPEIASTERVVGTELALPSLVNVQGKVIHLASGATILAPGARLPSGADAVKPVTNTGLPFAAGVWLNSGIWNFVPSGNAPTSDFVRAGGQVYLDSGATINVAGSTDVSALITENILTLQLRGAEFSNSPLNRQNFNVRGVDLTIDIRRQGVFNGFAWVGTPLADASGFVGLILRNVAELTTAGGTVNINSGGSVVAQKGSTIDVSGGWINYQGGVVSTSRLLYGGYIYDISQATPDRVYDGVYTGKFSQTSAKWGVTKTYTVPFMLGEHYDPGYIFGMSGGSISVTAPSVALDGTLSGNTVSGPRQRDLPAAASSLLLNFQAQKVDMSAGYPVFSPTPPLVVFESGVTQQAPGPFHLDVSGNPDVLPADRLARVVLSPGLLTENGFGSLTIKNPDGNILVPAGEELIAPAKGDITFSAANVDIEGKVVAPGGKLEFNAYNISPTEVARLKSDTANSTTPAPDPNRGMITLGPDASLSTAGLVIDDRLSAPAPLSLPLVTAGGTISLNGYSADLASGSVIDVSGGVVLDAFGKRTYGSAGSIAIKTGQDLNLPSVLGGQLILGSTLKGMAGGQATGGSLALQAMRIQVGGASSVSNTLLLQPEFFNEGGFASFTLNGLGTLTGSSEYAPGLLIAPGTEIDPVVQSYVAAAYGDGSSAMTLVPVTLPEGMRSPVTLNFGAVNVLDDFTGSLAIRADVVLGQGAVVHAGPLGVVTFKGDTVALFGSVYAPGGSIQVSGAKSLPLPNKGVETNALATVYIGPQSVLSTAGKVVLTPDAYGRRTGMVLPGGSISVSGNIVAESGSVLDVSGTSGMLDIAPAYLGLTTTLNPLTGAPVVQPSSGLTSPLYSRAVVRTKIDSNGGSITLKGSEELFSRATLLGNAGGPTATGGTLSIQSGRFYGANATALPNDFNLVVTQNATNLPAQFFASGSGIGRAVLDGNGQPMTAMGYFAVNDFAGGGFDSLSLGGNVAFSGPVNITARGKLIVATGGVLGADSAVNLKASYVALGTPFQAPLLANQPQNPFNTASPFYFLPTFGTGSLTVTANSIDIGNLSLQTIGSARLIADNGDIRGDGTLDIAGSLYLRAAQIYPTTASRFTIAAYDYTDGGVLHDGSVTIAASGTKSLPLSAGGTLSIYASRIIQGGVLRAPFGVINLGWDGTGTSPQDYITGAGVAGAKTQNYTPPSLPVTKQITLLAGSVTSVSAIDPITGQGILIPYGTSVDGKSWIDPAGNDITNGGLPQKAINFSSQGIQTDKGSIIDIRGGGDLYAYRWVSGQTGTTDILASTGAFAVIPGYSSNFAPYGAFNGSSSEARTALNSDPGYVNSKLNVGDQVYLNGGSGLPAGVYTLLPARYALMPGAFLVTPSSGVPIGNFLKPDGSSFVNGYRFNSLNGERTVSELYSRFEIAPGSTIAQRAQYDSFFANSFLSAYAAAHNQTVQPLPKDSGQLVFSAGSSLVLNGTVLARSLGGGRGGRVDISSAQNIIIASADLITQLGAGGLPNTLLLDSAQLSAFGAESLLIGGVRSVGADGTTVTVKTGSILVSNQGSPLTGSEIILAANNSLTVADNAVIKQTGTLTGTADTLLLGSASVAGSGSGVLLRVSSDVGAQIVRAGVGSPTQAGVSLNIGNSALIGGNSIILDSTAGSQLAGSAVLVGKALSLNSGHISLQLSNPAPPLYQSPTEPVTNGLVLGTSALQGLEGFSSLSLLSYSAIDVYGAGTVGNSTLAHLALHAAQIRGFDVQAGETASFNARSILIDNNPNGKVLEDRVASGGTLALNASNIHIGVNKLNIDQYANLELNASAGLYLDGSGALEARDGAITANTPFIAAARSATQAITAHGALVIDGVAGGTVTSGLGGSLALQGASVNVTSNIVLPSGQLSITALSGDVVIGGKLDVSGSAQTFYDLTKYTSAGSISITSNTGNVVLNATSIVDVAAKRGGGDAGTLFLGAAHGQATLDGTLLGQAGAGGKGGSFSLDVGSLASLSAMNAKLDGSGFNETRSFRVRTGDVLVDGSATTRTFNLSADLGAINVTGTIDASGTTGGSIFLSAFKGLTLSANALLDVSATTFNSAGKGGSVDLETRGDGGATINLLQDSTIDLSVAAAPKLGQFSGTLHLRAPQNAASTDLQVGTINGTIRNASSIIVEGFKVFDLSGRPSSEITTADRNNVFNNGIAFLGAAGTTTANYTAMLNRLEGTNPALRFNPDVLTIRAGAEIIREGDLTVGNTAAGNAADWDLHSYRFGPNGSPGVLTLRATGNLIFLNALSDGFASSAYNAALLAPSNALPDNAQSWSYRLTAGADLSAVDFRQVKAINSLAAGKGSLQLGKFSTGIADPDSQGDRFTAKALQNAYQVIRTGSGDIDVSAGRDVQLLNQFASIFTAGTRVKDPTLGGTFDTPVLDAKGGDDLGEVQQTPSYPAQYTLGGGNVTINAQNDIAHLTMNTLGALIPDSERELPNNWLYRRGYVDPAGNFGGGAIGSSASTTWSTTWWVDFSNFFEGVGALGGGNVTINAGRDISNVDAVIPTNARMAARSSGGTALKPDAGNLVELGGGDLMVHAGRNIDAGVYYVESGHGTLKADGSIITNSTRSPSLGSLNGSAALPEETWLPTSLFLGKSSFDVTARGDLLLGPSSNVFLIPEGVNNTYWYKTYFSTYGTTAAVNVQSLGGDVTLRESAALPGPDSAPENLITTWLRNVQLFSDLNASFYQPWLRLDETKIDPYVISTTLQPGTLRVTAFAGDININGSINLTPSPTGSLDFAAAGAINGLQITGTVINNDGSIFKAWTSARINVSDADPAILPGVATPVAYQGFVSPTTPANTTGVNILAALTTAFTESGSTSGAFGVLQTKQALHAAGLLHAGDTEPLHLYAGAGDISGVTLFSPKQARVVAARDITDVAFYIQNTGTDDVSVVASGRDIIAYDANSVLRSAARLAGNLVSSSDHTLEGDIQISGPGTLEVLAGRNLDLGVGSNNSDGTGVGITSIGNGRNPSLPFEGASIIAGAGIGPSFDLGSTSLDFDAFIAQSIKGANGARYLADYAAASGSPVSSVAAFNALSKEEQERVALEVFFIVLRDAGRDHNLAGSPGFGNYAAGIAAVSTLFTGTGTTGDITTQARDIRTKSGGDITLFAPVGGLTLATSVLGSPLAPPGIITESGGNISIVTKGNVDIGISRIFTLRGGNEIIWSSAGNIAAGSSSKTVQSAPPTRVVIDPQSGDVKTDLAGLATGGGIGVLATVVGVAPGSVDLIAPTGSIDAGDAGIRATGNLNIAAVTVLNASNISVGGTSVGSPATAAPSAPTVAVAPPSTTPVQPTGPAAGPGEGGNKPPPSAEDMPSIFNVEVIGYGGGEGEDDEEELKKRRKAALPQ